eukprot:4013913-Pyramimonas_sp.AAC.1
MDKSPYRDRIEWHRPSCHLSLTSTAVSQARAYLAAPASAHDMSHIRANCDLRRPIYEHPPE